MKLRAPSYPEQVLEAATDILRERIAGERGKQKRKRRGDLLILPVYGVPLESLAKGELRPSRLTGWRAIWIEERRRIGATLEFQRAKGGRPKFSTWSFGAKARETAAALVALAQQEGSDGKTYSPSILKVSALQIDALWLRPSRGEGAIYDATTHDAITDIARRTRAIQKLKPPSRRPNKKRAKLAL